MLCVTFTNRAAREMRTRIESYLGYYPHDLFAGNMHRFCLQFLYRNNIISADTSVLDEDDRLDLLATILPDKRNAAVTDFLTKAAYVYQTDHDHPEYIIRHPHSHISDADYEAIEKYARFKEHNRLIDYDDILLLAYTALQQRPAADYVMTDYCWAQVDEVQDMTPLQLAIVDAVMVRHGRTLIYFGDEQQAIFKFIGAGGRALEVLKRQCRGNILRLQRNYRSPGYLVEMCNALATDWLGIDADLLPQAVENTTDSGNLTLFSGSRQAISFTTAHICRKWRRIAPDDSIAVVCRTNREAEELSALFTTLSLPHFHVPRQDLFHRVPFKTVWSHLAVVAQPFLMHPWARLLYQLRCVPSMGEARKLIGTLRNCAIGGDELLSFDKPLRIERLIDLCDSDKAIVVFDTETTGLDIRHDHVVQIAAAKIVQGKITDTFEVFIDSDRPLPATIDGRPNPIAEAYAQAHKLSPDDAFNAFVSFIGKATLAGHNLDFDVPIMRRNMATRSTVDIPWQLMPLAERLDTLTLSRQLYPRLHSHRLGDMIAHLGISGINSHNAADDAAATAHLLLALADHAHSALPHIQAARDNRDIRRAADRFHREYAHFYLQCRSALYNPTESNANTLSGAIASADHFMTAHGYTDGIARLDYVKRLVDKCVTAGDEATTFGPQLMRHLFDLLSFNEGDLYTNGIIDERLSIMTIHKAKGMEMDRVVVYDSDSFFGPLDDQARLLYVAFSRARHSLAVAINGNMPRPLIGLQRYFTRLTPAQVRMATAAECLNLSPQ